MLGQDLTPLLEARHTVFPLSRVDADITDGSQVRRAVERVHPEVVIHAAAYTAVDDAEIHPDLAFRVNAMGTYNVALACRDLGVSMLYLSTDYVFDGDKEGAYVESDLPNPANVYGQTKLEGERHVIQLLKRYWIVRTSWLFGAFSKNFVRTILERAGSGAVLRVVDDQIGSPTYTLDLAAKLVEIFEAGAAGVYHVTNQGACSWFEFAREILRQANLDPARVTPIVTSASGRQARRPRNSRLENMRLAAEKFELLPDWRDALRRYLARGIQLRPGSTS